MSTPEPEHMVTRPLYLRITDSRGISRVEERQTWGQDGPERVHLSIARSYANEWAREECPGNPPRVDVITRDEYDRARFAGRP